ncbi:MAG: sporulation integral membrane protein YtvI [Syntrophomonadaceae bacterium]|jgi:sporulation integral membrane protein YtvI
MDPELQKNLKYLVRLSLVVLSLLALYLTIIYIVPMLGQIFIYVPMLFLPFIIAIIMAVVMEPVVVFFEQRLHLNRNGSVIISLILVVGGFCYALSIIITNIIYDITRLYPHVAGYSNVVKEKILPAITDVQLLYLQLDLPLNVQGAIEENLHQAVERLISLMDKSVEILINSLSMLPGFFIFLIIATVATYFFIKDRALIRDFVLSMLPPGARFRTQGVISHLFKALVGFVKAYSILISITAIITMIALKIIGVDYILTIGLIVGLLDILPILGPGLLFIPWIIGELFFGSPAMGISLLVLYGVISVVRQFLEPKIVGDNIGLHPLATLIALYVGLKLGGVPGMFLGPVILVIIIACHRTGLFNGLNWGKNE